MGPYSTPTRRAVIAGAAAALATPAAARPAESATRIFDIVRKGSQIGQHVVTVKRDARGQISVVADSDYRLSFLGLTRAQFSQRVTEIWRDKRLVSMVSRTNDNGARAEVTVGRTSEGKLRVMGGPRAIDAPHDAGVNNFVSTELLTRSRWIRSEDGEVMAITAYRRRPTSILGRRCTRWLVSDPFGYARDLYYDARGEWLGADTQVSGATARYRARATEGELARIWAGL